ncbi:MAG TPA: response regulator transcription factor [Vicinamibacterales bacterium]
MIRILCVDDHRIVREGIASLIDRQPDMRVVASAASGEEAIDLFIEHQPDITLMDLQLGVMDGITAIKIIRRRSPGARIVVLTMRRGDEDIHRALEAGASAYLMKDTISDDLIRVLREVQAGEHPMPADVEARLAERATRATLTDREVQVVELVAQGMRNKEIGVSLGISETTVQVHVKNILAKLRVQDRSGAITAAIRRGIIHIS